MNGADICRKNGWTAGTILKGDGECIRITAIGDELVLAVAFDELGLARREVGWAIHLRDWEVVSVPPPDDLRSRHKESIQLAWKLWKSAESKCRMLGELCEAFGGDVEDLFLMSRVEEGSHLERAIEAAKAIARDHREDLP